MNKTTRITLKLLLLITIFTLTLLAIKNIEHKSTIIIDTKESECYSNCNETKLVTLPLDDSILVSEIQNYKLANYKENLTERKRVAEAKRLVELEAKRIAKQKADEEAKKKKYVVVSRGSASRVNTYVYEVTAYTAGYESTGKRPGDKGYRQTASGAYVKEGVTIACPKDFEFGTKIEIEGYGMRICQDTGSAIGSGKLDLFMESLSAANEFGRQKLQVKIYR